MTCNFKPDFDYSQNWPILDEGTLCWSLLSFNCSCNEVWVLDLVYMNWTLKDIQGVKPHARYGHSQVSSLLTLQYVCQLPNFSLYSWIVNISRI